MYVWDVASLMACYWVFRFTPPFIKGIYRPLKEFEEKKKILQVFSVYGAVLFDAFSSSLRRQIDVDDEENFPFEASRIQGLLH